MSTIAKKKLARRARIKRGIRSKISGNEMRPRLSVFRSNKEIYVQLIDDLNGKTLASANSTEMADDAKGKTKTEVAKLVGKRVAEKAKDASISTVVFDRNGYLYHGRVKALAEAARENGLKF